MPVLSTCARVRLQELRLHRQFIERAMYEQYNNSYYNIIINKRKNNLLLTYDNVQSARIEMYRLDIRDSLICKTVFGIRLTQSSRLPTFIIADIIN